MMTPFQCRLARAALEWTTHDLGKKAGVSANTVSKFERSKVRANTATVRTLQRSLEDAGVIFIQGEDGEGVLLRPRL